MYIGKHFLSQEKKPPGVATAVKRRVSTTLDAWREIIDSSIIRKFVFYSNANQATNSVKITEDDVLQFIGLQYARGIYGKHIPRDFLWNKQYG